MLLFKERQDYNYEFENLRYEQWLMTNVRKKLKCSGKVLLFILTNIPYTKGCSFSTDFQTTFNLKNSKLIQHR